jgi:7-carboxy-7-deazaguanine synthase
LLGDNPIRGVVMDSGDELYVQEIFLTIQGEGPFVGRPAIFVRLGGCNLACKFCDTEFESFQKLPRQQIISKICELRTNLATNLVVITGGEPMRQSIEVLCRDLLDKDFNIQIETNGTIFRHLPAEVSIVCSPKPSKLGYHKIRPDLLERFDGLKFLISKSMPQYTIVPDVGQSEYQIPIYLQPMDQQNEQLNMENIKHTIYLVQKFGYILSLQTHKFIGIP